MVTQMHTNSNNILTSISPMQVWRRSTKPCAAQALPTWNAHAGQRETPGTLRKVIEFMCTISHKLKG